MNEHIKHSTANEEIPCVECIYADECGYKANSGACPCGVR